MQRRARTKSTGRHEAPSVNSFVDKLDYIAKPLQVELDDDGNECIMLPIEQFDRMLRDMANLSMVARIAVADWESQPSVSFEEFVAALKAVGKLPPDWMPSRSSRNT